MSLDKDQIKADLQRVLFRKDVDEDKLSLFVDDLENGINSGWNLSSSVSKKIGLHNLNLEGEEDFNFLLKNITDLSQERNKEIRTNLKNLLKKTERLQNHFNNFLTEETLSSVEHSIKFKDSIDKLVLALKADLELIPKKKKGRKPSPNKSLFVRHVFAMADCLLNTKAVMSNESTLFNKVLRECYKGINDNTEECTHYIKPCYQDYDTVYNLAFSYKKYDRLDLYVKHVKNTNFRSQIVELFQNDWSEWKKPHNFNILENE